MITYQITEAELNRIVEYAQEHPDEEFYVEPMNDGDGIEDEFLSCAFWDNENDNRTTGIWELSYSSGEYDDEDEDIQKGE